MSCLLSICPVLSGYVLNYYKIFAYNLFLLFIWIESVLGNRICPGSWIQQIHIISDPDPKSERSVQGQKSLQSQQGSSQIKVRMVDQVSPR